MTPVEVLGWGVWAIAMVALMRHPASGERGGGHSVFRASVPRPAGRFIVHAAVIGLLLVAMAFAGRSPARAACHPIEVTWWSPTGVAGCALYGEGIASMWGGPGAARNDCIYPWRDCQPIAVQSLDTGLVIQVTPTMYGDLYVGTADQRIVDLDPDMVAALGLDPADGLWDVKVWPVDNYGHPVELPDTALR